MKIKRGSAIRESAKAVLTEDKFKGSNKVDEKFILVEGSDDIEVIKRYCLYNDRKLHGYRIVSANINDEKKGGKRNALDTFKDLCSKEYNVVCLLDRDYDFFLNEKESDPRIKYYNYYELENYILEDKLIIITLRNSFNFNNNKTHDLLIKTLNEIEKSFVPYVLLCYLRELNYRRKVLTDEQLTVVLNIIKLNPISIMKMDNVIADSKLKKINAYIESELSKVLLDMEAVRKIIIDSDTLNSAYEDILLGKSEPLDLLKYGVKGKVIIKYLSEIFKVLGELNYILEDERIKDNNQRGILSSLKDEWLPAISVEFSSLINELFKELDKEPKSSSLQHSL